MREAPIIDRLVIPPAVAREIVEQAAKVYLRDCPCRAREQNCPPETWEVCLLFENASQDELQDARRITSDETLSVLETTAERGAIYNLFYTQTDQKVTELCSCCFCCCAPLLQLRQKGNYGEQLRSNYVAVTDASLCVGCGLCEERCFFEARRVENGALQLVDERCFGCGVCVRDCPEGAIRLEWQAGRGITVPRNV